MTITVRFLAVSALCMTLIAAILPVEAQEPRALGTYRDWSAFAWSGNAEQVCYAASQPTRSEGNYTRRGDVWFLVTHRSPGGQRDIVQIQTGYRYLEDAPVTVTIADETFELFSKDESAWAYTAHQDRDLVAAMKAGVTMVVRGRSWRGTDTTDTFSLLGFTAAYDSISQTCAN